MFSQYGICLKQYQGIQGFCQSHLVIKFMDALVALTTNIDAFSECFTGKVLAVKSPPVHFTWDQMVEG